MPRIRNTPTTDALDRLRASDYSRLDAERHVYLDYTGGSLYGASQVRDHQALLTDRVFGNPHSASLCSTATTDLVEQTRRAVLKYFNAPPDQYTAVFTANATGALKLAGEAYPFAGGGRCLLTFDNHNSVNGIREFARAKGACVEYAPHHRSRICGSIGSASTRCSIRPIRTRANLFAFPAQSNFSGVKHPLDLIERAHGKGWDVLLDAAAFVPTNRLDLTRGPARFRRDLVLQDVRLSHRRGVPHRARRPSCRS